MAIRTQLVAALLASLAGCRGEAPGDTPPAAATYTAAGSGQRIGEEEYLDWARHRRLKPGEATRREALEQLALAKVLAAEAAARGLDAKADVDFRLTQERAERLEKALRNHVAREIVVSEDAVRERYEAKRERFVRPASRRLMHVFKSLRSDAPESARAAARAELGEVRRRVLAGEDFSALARIHSDSQSRFRGGVIGYVAPGQLPPEVERVAFALAPGEVSDVVAVPDGLAIFRCDALRDAVATPFEEARPELERTLRAAAQDRRWNELASRFRSEAAIAIDWDVVEGAASGTAEEATAVRSRQGDLRRWELALVLQGEPRAVAGRRPRIERAVERHLLQRAAAKEAQALGLDRDPVVMRDLALDRMTLLATERMRELVAPRVARPSEEEVRAYWSAHRGAFRSRPRYDLSAIEIPSDPARKRESYLRALEIAESVASGALPFEEAARRHSTHPSASSGGHVGWISGPKLASLPNVLATVERLAPGAVSPLVDQDGTFWIVRLEDAEAGREIPYEEARPRAERRLGNERVRALQLDLERQLLATLDLKVSGDGNGRAEAPGRSIEEEDPAEEEPDPGDQSEEASP